MTVPLPMDTKIRPAEQRDYPAILEIYARARRYMAETGNPNQWGENHPPVTAVQRDIAQHRSYVCVVCGAIEAVFMLQSGEDPTYAKIDGAWRSDAPYHTVHRIASSGRYSGIFDFCIQWCYSRVGHLRIDTHEDNRVMQHLILKNGFTRCGIIDQPDGSSRIAYEKL
ncbi:MAG: GNAT family N-acetyltransferase [Oscillospiraceae bacterium]|nr:GNAT family N-acetyltransferase [Oscillospiraceae bacterium]